MIKSSGRFLIVQKKMTKKKDGKETDNIYLLIETPMHTHLSTVTIPT